MVAVSVILYSICAKPKLVSIDRINTYVMLVLNKSEF